MPPPTLPSLTNLPTISEEENITHTTSPSKHISQLSEPLLLYIFCFLDPSNYLAISLTCRLFKRIVQDNVWYRTQLRRYFPLQWMGPNIKPQESAPEDYLPRSYFLRHYHTIPIKASPQARQCCLWIMTSDTTALQNAGFTFRDLHCARLELGKKLQSRETETMTETTMLTWMTTPQHATLQSYLYQQRLEYLDTNRFWHGEERVRTFLLGNTVSLTVLDYALILKQPIATIEALIGPIAALNDMEKRRLWFKAVAAGHMPMTKRLFNSIISVNMPNNCDFHALYLATLYGQTAMVHFLLKNGADVELGFGTETPLSAAVNHDFNDIVVMLLHAGAKVEGNTNNCSLPLSTALYKKNEAIVHLLLKHNMNVSATGYHGTTALHIAASYGRDTIATYLLARGADASANKTHTKNTPLHNATEKGFTQCAAVLIQAAPTVINQQNMTDETPLHIAAKKGHQAIVQLMLHSGTAQLDLEDEWGCTPYQIAKQHNHEAVAQLLAEHHANTPSSSQKKLAYTM